MDYKELQENAKKLGLPFVGVSRNDLEKSIKEASGEAMVGEESGPLESSPAKEPKPKSSVNKANVAVVYDGRREVRRYTFEQHGKEFASLAQSFVSKPNNGSYKVELTSDEPRVKCPNCGHRFSVN